MTIRNAASMGTHGSDWQANGYAGRGNVQTLIGSLKGRVAFIAGSGETVFEDLRKAEIITDDPVIFAVNDVGMFLPKVNHWVSLHGQYLGTWKMVRWLHPASFEDTKYHSCDSYPHIDYVWSELTPCFALSGYYAMQIAYIMGAEQIVLCGCPGDPSRRFFDIHPRGFGYGGAASSTDKGIRNQLLHEMRRLPDFKERVVSMSGWTKEYFGGV